MNEPDDDALLDALGALAREDGPAALDDPRWDALADGVLSPEDEAALRALAAGEPPVAARLAAFAPLPDPVRARFADAALGALGEERGAASADGAPGGKVLAFGRRRWPVVVGVALVAAAAAALLVSRAPPPALPAYGVEVSGGQEAVREHHEEEATGRPPPRLSNTDPLVVRLVPDDPIEGAIAVRAAAIRDGIGHPLTVDAEVSAEGAVRLAGTPAALGIGGFDRGLVTLRFAVGRPDALPPAEAIPPGGGAGWQAFDVEVELVAGPGP